MFWHSHRLVKVVRMVLHRVVKVVRMVLHRVVKVVPTIDLVLRIL